MEDINYSNTTVSPKTYITKEKFVDMINSLEFTHIENAEINFITAFLFNNVDDTVKPKGYKISIY